MKATQRDFASTARRAADQCGIFFFCGPDEAGASAAAQSITELLGLDDNNKYGWREIFRFEGRGRGQDGRIQGDLVPAGSRPTFADEPFQMGLADQIKLSSDLFTTE